MTDNLNEDMAIHGPPRFFSLPLAEAFLVLSAILGVFPGLILGVGLFASLFSGLDAIIQGLHVAMYLLAILTVLPPFITLLWLGTGLAAMVQWTRLRRDWVDRQRSSSL